MKCIIVRGLPGSGKSTWIKNNFGGSLPVICSADHYFTVEGEYKYDHAKIGEAQEACFANFFAALEAKSPLIITDNVMHKLWHVSPYKTLAEYKGYDVKIVHIYCQDPGQAWSRNVHSVPEDKFGFLADSFERAPRAWNEASLTSDKKVYF